MTEVHIDYERIIKGVTNNLAHLFGKEVPVEALDKKELKKKALTSDKLKYKFSEVLYDPENIRSLKERTNPEWSKKISYFLTLFQEHGEPITIHPSIKYDEDSSMKPMKATVFPKDAGTVASDLHLLLQKNRIGERTWNHHLIFGLSIPSPSEREEATRFMRGALGFKSTSKKFSKKLSSMLKASGDYVEPKDTRKDIGDSYEQQLEYYFYMHGFHVYHNGMHKKYNDKGVDLVLVKNGETHLVQAKSWSRNKKITPHDVEVIYQKMQDWYKNNKEGNKEIFGPLSRVMLVVANGDCLPEETRERCAELGLTFKIVSFEDSWKKAKCIIAKNGDKIFYVPEHGAWKKLDMHVDKRRFWATVDEAKAKGYRPPGVKKK